MRAYRLFVAFCWTGLGRAADNQAHEEQILRDMAARG
jgi:hypothetical protein